MTTLARRLTDLERQNPVQFVVPDIGAPVESIDAAQALWIALMVPGQSAWHSAALQKFDAMEFVEFSKNDRALRTFVDALSEEALNALIDGLRPIDEHEATRS